MLVFTSCINNYLPKARVLAQSLKEQHPDWQFHLLLGEDLPPGCVAAAEPFDRILGYAEIGIPDLRAFLFKHKLVELCTAVKGAALNYFLENEGQPRVMYLDPDILVLGSLAPLTQMLDAHDILLTPHQLAPQIGAQAIEDNEICSLRHGVFNLGFTAVANRPEGIAFSRFWRDRLLAYCHDDKHRGLFTDQKWCDLAPAYFPSLGIVRDPGCNAASWNLTDRKLTQDDSGQFLANGQPLRFYHFTGYDSGMGRVMSSIYGANMPAVAELWRLYDQKLKAAGQEELGKLPWTGNVYSNGQPISPEARFYYRENPFLHALYPDPFLTDASGKEGFSGHWAKHKATEGNRLYVLARKPFRLAWLAHAWLVGHGGIKAAPQLWRVVSNAWRQGGATALLAKIRQFKQKVNAVENTFRLDQLLKPPNSAFAHCSQALRAAFAAQNGVLLLDHMYGGGANDYRECRIAEYLQAGRPCLLLAWDFFSRRLRLRFNLPGGRILHAEALDLADIIDQNELHFGHILVSELVLWSSTRPAPASHYDILPQLLRQIVELKRKNKATLEIAAHDFYSICPSYNLLEKGGTYCGVSEDGERCRACLAAGPFDIPQDFDIGAWRAAWQDAFAACETVSMFSNATCGILRKVFTIRPEQAQIRPHAPLAQLAAVELPRPPGPLHVGVMGHIAHHKGAKIVRQMAKLLKPGEKLTVIGSLDGPQPENITATGNYRRDDLPALLREHGVNCCLVPSIWPETFCYVAQEIMQMRMPLVVFPLGAQAERVKTYPFGMIAEEISAEAALKSLRQLHAADPTA